MDLKQAIQTIEAGAWLSIRFITADVKKGTGGKVIELAKCRIARNRNPLLAKIKEHAEELGLKRDPAHHLHFTRNLELPNKQIRKVHPILITHVNQEAVI